MIEPGKVCETCERRVPYPKKDTSPTTKRFGYQVPVDEFDAHKVVLEEVAKHLGTYGRPHWQFWTMTYLAAYALAAYALQDDALSGAGQRSEVAA